MKHSVAYCRVGRLTAEVKLCLRQWLFDNAIDNQVPSTGMIDLHKPMLRAATGLNERQLGQWFKNRRRDQRFNKLIDKYLTVRPAKACQQALKHPRSLPNDGVSLFCPLSCYSFASFFFKKRGFQ